MHKSHIVSDRTSCRSPIANQVHLVLHTAACWLMLTVRDTIPKAGGEVPVWGHIAKRSPFLGDLNRPSSVTLARWAIPLNTRLLDFEGNRPCRTVP
jgi:hypothetical protein